MIVQFPPFEFNQKKRPRASGAPHPPGVTIAAIKVLGAGSTLVGTCAVMLNEAVDHLLLPNRDMGYGESLHQEITCVGTT